MQRNEKIWIHEACSPSSSPQTLCKLFTFDEQSGKHLSTLCSWCSLCNKYHAACISSGAITPQNRQMAEDSLHFHWPANRAFRMFYNTKEKRATHSWVIVLHKGPGVCKASLRTDGYKPLWLYSPHRQTLNQVKHSEHRLHGKTRKLRVQILVSGRNRSGYPKPLAQNFPAQDQYISIIIVGLCVERAMPAPPFTWSESWWRISSLKKFENRTSVYFQNALCTLVPIGHFHCIFLCRRHCFPGNKGQKRTSSHTLIWLTLFLNSLISLYRKRGGKWYVDHFLSIAGALYEIKFHYVVKLFDF